MTLPGSPRDRLPARNRHTSVTTACALRRYRPRPRGARDDPHPGGWYRPRGVPRGHGPMSLLGRALELAERGRGSTHPNPVVGAVVARGDEIAGEGWHERAGGPHAEIRALEAAGEQARGATLHVTLEPCAHHGRTPPCVDAVLTAGIARVVIGSLDPSVDAGGGAARLRAAGVEVELVDSFEARAQNEGWRTWTQLGRPFVTYKVAATLDGRVTAPGRRWLSGEQSRRVVHELRARSDAVAVGMGTVRADLPRLDARGVEAARQPRRLAFGRGPLPGGAELELRPGPLARRAAVACGRGRADAAAGGRADARRRVLRRRPRRQADRVRRAAPVRDRPPPARRPRATRRADVTSQSSAVGEDAMLTAYVRDP